MLSAPTLASVDEEEETIGALALEIFPLLRESKVGAGYSAERLEDELSMDDVVANVLRLPVEQVRSGNG